MATLISMCLKYNDPMSEIILAVIVDKENYKLREKCRNKNSNEK